MKCGGIRFWRGCTCGDCQAIYIGRFANSCTYPRDPRLPDKLPEKPNAR